MEYKKGRGAQINTRNKFLRNENTRENVESIDDWTETNSPTQYIEQEAKSIVNKVDSPDVGMWYSMNPYAGCEHGCIYCYARNTHEYWGYSAGTRFREQDHREKKCAETAEEIPDESQMGSAAYFAEREYGLLSACGKKISTHPRIAGSL